MSGELPGGHAHKILVVEDTAANLQLLTNLLTKHFYTVYPASDGELALEFVRTAIPDLILLDIRMPGMDGYEVCRHLKADVKTRDVPVIFISALEDERDKVRGFQAGAVDYITKPFQAEEILARVRSHLHLRELTEHLEQKVAERTDELNAAYAQLQRELAERKQAEAALRQSETLLNATQRLAKIGGWEWDVEQQTTFWTEETYRIHGFEPQAFAPKSTGYIDRSLSCYDPADRPVILTAFQRCAQQGDSYDLEFPITSADGCRKWIRTTGAAVRENGRIMKVVGNIVDVTERKRAEAERQAQLRFFEGMDRINRAIQGSDDLEQMMSDVLDVVISIFDCDRAFLLYPCDPESATWSAPMERNKPEYPGVGGLGIEMAMAPAVAETFRILIAADGPVKFGPGTSHAVPMDIAVRFCVKCSMSMAIYPKAGKPWQFGIHQCSRARVWTMEEERFFKEIGRRLTDSISSLRIYRELKESEQGYRMVFENSPVSIWEEDFSEVRTFFDSLKKEETSDIGQYLCSHPDAVRHCAKLAKVTNVNRAALALHGAMNKEELFASLINTFTEESFDVFRQELVCLWNGETEMVSDAVVKTLAGEARHVTVYFSVCPGYEGSLARILVSLVDISSRKQAEKAVMRLNEELDRRVHERTAELEKANNELQKLNKLFVGRELRMVELKKRIAELEKENDTDNMPQRNGSGDPANQ